MSELVELLKELSGDAERSGGWVNARAVAKEAADALETQEARIEELERVLTIYYAALAGIMNAESTYAPGIAKNALVSALSIPKPI